ncbi:BQ5605_C023g09621 [Microbotryum silenes-dioicae]|uniref:BQ5605_C023g09621 protein n=1 Tax=Microbotryum silenes-dioicae TaxID=796604 RepID=A0A2X0MPW6_9BASI|nr:BQ5605_C023g09621 [Microbotryum silenes-dioicae]
MAPPFISDGTPGNSHVSLSFVPQYSTVEVVSRTIYGASGRMHGRFTGVSLSGANKCAATQFNSNEGRDYDVVAYGCTFNRNHTGAKMIFNVLPCGNTEDALSLAQKIRGVSKKEDFKFKKANPKSSPSRKSSGKSGAHRNTPHRPQSDLSSSGQPGRHHVGGYRGRRHSGHGRRRGGHGGHGGHGHEGGNHHGGGHGHKGGNHHGGGHGHKGGNHHGGGHPQHHHVRSLCTGNSLACQRRRQYLAKRDSRSQMLVSPQGPSPQGPSPQGPVSPSGTPKQSASGASGGAGSAAGDHGPGPQSTAKKTQDGAVSQQASKDPNPASEADKSNSEIADHLRKNLMSGKAQTVCIVGQDHLSDMQTAGLTGKETVGAGGVPGLMYDLFDASNDAFWLTMTRVN